MKPPKDLASAQAKTSSPKPNGQPGPGSIGNTVGQITPMPDPNGGIEAGQATPIKPPVKPETPAEASLWSKIGGAVHTGLDVLGFVPGLGAIPDLANAGLYALEGDTVNAAISAMAAVPGIGDAAKAGTMVAKGGKAIAKEAAEKAAKEAAEKAAKEKAEKELAEKIAKEKAEKEAAQQTGGKPAKEDGGYVKRSGERSAADVKKEQVRKNKRDGTRREQATEQELKDQYPEASVQREQYLRDSDGKILKDPLTGEARRVDHVVIKDGKVIDMVETTSKSVDKAEQIAKENRILDAGGRFVRDRTTGQTVPVGEVPIRIIRRD